MKYGTNEKPDRVSALTEGDVVLPWTPEEVMGLHLDKNQIIFFAQPLFFKSKINLTWTYFSV